MKYLKLFKFLPLIIVLLQIQINLRAQPVYFSGIIDSKDINPIALVQLGLQTNRESNKNYSMNVMSDGTFSITINDIEEGLYKIKDAFIGHKIFISTGDTVRIRLEKIAKPSFEIFHKMYVDTRFPMNYMFFDSCLSFFGHTKPAFSKTNFDDSTYKIECHQKYQRALNLLTHFHAEKKVTDSFFKYAQIELKLNYFDWLLFPFTKYNVSKKSISAEYFKELNAFPFDDLDAVRKTELYLVVANRFNNFGLNTVDNDNREPYLFSSFKTAASHFKGIVRDRLMAWKIEEIIRLSSDSSKIDSVLSYFYKECKTPAITDELTAKIGAWGVRIKNTPALFRELLDKTLYSDLKGNKYSLRSLPVNKQWILIDCWASWCKPCKIQEPFFDYFKQRFRNSVAFLKFSLDEDKSAWEKDIVKYKKDSSINYLVKGGNENPFSYFFEIKSIPRFILIDLENKKVINDNMPFPENKEQFEKAINDVIHGKQN